MLIRGLYTLAELYTQCNKLKRTSVRYFDLLDGKPLIESMPVWTTKSSRPKRLPQEGVIIPGLEFEGRLQMEVMPITY